MARSDWIMEITEEMARTANDEITDNRSMAKYQLRPSHVILGPARLGITQVN